MTERLELRDLCLYCIEEGVPDLFYPRKGHSLGLSYNNPNKIRDDAKQEDPENGLPAFSVRFGSTSEVTVSLGLASQIRSRLPCPFCEMVSHVLVPELFEPPYEGTTIYAERNHSRPALGDVALVGHEPSSRTDSNIYITFRGNKLSVVTLGCFRSKPYTPDDTNVWVTDPADGKDPFRDVAHTTSAYQTKIYLRLLDIAEHGSGAQKRALREFYSKTPTTDSAKPKEQESQETSSSSSTASKFLDVFVEGVRTSDDMDTQPASAFDIILIDVNEKCLVERTTAEKYLALSYVWGGDQKAKLYQSIRHSLQQSKALEKLELSRVVTDAMDYTLELGHCYLWVDALCIEQDEDSQHKKQQLSIMDKIYEGSYLTLVAWTATCSNSPLQGVGTMKLRPQVMHRAINFKKGDSQSPIVLENRLSTDLQFLGGYSAISHYDTRAWTLQERLLSARCLCFHHRETLLYVKTDFEGNKGLGVCGVNSRGTTGEGLSEDMTIIGNEPDFSEMVGQVYGLGSSVAPQLSSHTRLIEAYTRLNLTDPSDRLTAVTGILTSLKPIIGDTVQGLPVSHLARTLAWTPSSSSQRGTRNINFPSWTWAGWNIQASCTGLYMSGFSVDISSVYGSKSCNDHRRLLCEVADSEVVSKELNRAQSEPELGEIRVLHFSALSISSDECWFRGDQGESDKVYLANSDKYGDLDRELDVAKMNSCKSSSGFILLSHQTGAGRRFKYVTMLVQWKGSEASRVAICGFEESSFKSLTWVQKDIHLV